jgi:hypothetical protein
MQELATKANQLLEEIERLRLAPELDTFTLTRLTAIKLSDFSVNK